MCVIAIAIKHKLSLSVLQQCEDKNPHGGGVAWAEKGQVHFKKNISAQEAHDLVKDKPLPHVFHFRIASVGAVMPALCHPFPIRSRDNSEMEGTAGSVFFHNGTVHQWKFLARLAGVHYPDYASDSMVMARIAALRGKAILEEIQGGKYAILNGDGSINLYGEFQEQEGNLFSNLFWTYDARRAADAHRNFQSCGSTRGGDAQIRGMLNQQAARNQQDIQEQRLDRQADDFFAEQRGLKFGAGFRKAAHTNGGVVTTPGDRQDWEGA